MIDLIGTVPIGTSYKIQAIDGNIFYLVCLSFLKNRNMVLDRVDGVPSWLEFQKVTYRI